MSTRPTKRIARDPQRSDMTQSRLYFSRSFQFSAGMKNNAQDHSTRCSCPKIFPVHSTRRCSHPAHNGDVQIIYPVSKMRINIFRRLWITPRIQILCVQIAQSRTAMEEERKPQNRCRKLVLLSIIDIDKL